MRELQLQYQQSTGMWVDCDERTTEEFLKLCERTTGKSRQEVLSALEAGKVRYDLEDWYSFCRLKPAPRPVEVETVKCDYCGRLVPRISAINASLGTSCPDCYRD
jgi:formylmethanofuran dehydrogenase subunit E